MEGGIDMSEYKIITISRQFGSGGHEIGEKLADRLGIPFYDNQLVSMAAEQLGYTEESVGRADESALHSFITSYGAAPMSYASFINTASYMPSLDMKVYQKQTEIILSLAEMGPCVIVGRCADYILRDKYDCINVFICADKADRIRRIAERYDLTEKKAADRIRKTDRERKFYYETYTGLDWGSIYSHQALLNASLLGMDKIVDLLEMAYRA